MSFNLQEEIKKSFLTVELSIDTEVNGDVITEVFYEGPIPAITLDLHEQVMNRIIADNMSGNPEDIQNNLMGALLAHEMSPDIELSKKIVTSIGSFNSKSVTKYIKEQLSEMDIPTSKETVERLEGKMYAHFYGQIKSALEERNLESAANSADTPR